MWYTQAHDLAERPVGFVSNDHGDRGGLEAHGYEEEMVEHDHTQEGEAPFESEDEHLDE